MIPRIRRIQIRNYKSIAQTSVALEPFTVLVGPNGAGKSNFIDALAFVQECLSDSVELAFKNRGGITAVRRISIGHPTHIIINLNMELNNNLIADYSFEIAAKSRERFSIARERCVVHPAVEKKHVFDVKNGKFEQEINGIQPRIASDRLALYAASATEQFRPVYDFLTSMRIYSIEPVRLRELQDPDTGDHLKPDGSNAAAVLKRLKEKDEEKYSRICRLLEKVVTGVKGVEYRNIGQKETIQFRQDVGSKHPWIFDALNMSDGTLRVLGILLAVYQTGQHSVIAIEEPEATVHPAVSDLLVEVLMDAANERQVLLTTHSPDILDQKEIKDTHIQVVTTERNKTLVSPVSESGREAIRKRLYTPGELLRSNELNPDIEASKKAAEHINLFGFSSDNEVE
jgi:predicted ATPase